MIKRTIKCMLAVALTVAALAGPVRQAQAADLAFPILFVPLYSQNTVITPGVVTDTRITLFNPSEHCGPFEATLALCAAGAPLAALGPGFDVKAFFFDQNELLVTTPNFPMTPFDVLVITGPSIPNGTGTAIFVNTLAGSGVPIIALLHPMAAVVELGAKVSPGPLNIPDPLPGTAIGAVGSSISPPLFGVVASEAQVIPAISGEFPRIEISAAAAGAASLFFPAGGYETIIAETCLFAGAISNFIVNHDEDFLGSIDIFCTGLDTAGPPAVRGPDLVLFTPDDGGLLGTLASAIAVGPGGLLPGYNLLAIDADTFADTTLFHGMAIVALPDSAAFGFDRQAYAYNMPANYFFPTVLQAPSESVQETISGVTSGVANSLNGVVGGICDFMEHLGTKPAVETFGGKVFCDS